MKKVIVLLICLIPAVVFGEVVRKATAFHPNDVIKEITYFENDVEKAKEIYDETANLLEIRGSIPDGLVKEFYDDGKLKREYNYKNNKRDGIGKEYDEEGKLWSEWNYKNGEKDGISREYYNNGKLRAENNLKNGKPEGLCRLYYENGKLYAEADHKDDKALVKGYYESGNKNTFMDDEFLKLIIEGEV